MELITQPWSWYVGGPAISFVLFLMYYFGEKFGISSSLETFCTIGGAGKVSPYFNKDWKQQSWSLLFVVGVIAGGFLASNYLTPSLAIDLNPETVLELNNLGFSDVGKTYLPTEIFGKEALFSVKGILILVAGGFLIGFGARYAGGCTSGHAITGLSSFQLPSLLAVIGFFIGGLLMTWILMPLIFNV